MHIRIYFKTANEEKGRITYYIIYIGYTDCEDYGILSRKENISSAFNRCFEFIY